MPSAVTNGARGSEDDIVLTGLSGRLPQSDTIEEFAQQLFDGVDLVTADDRRWTPAWPLLRHESILALEKRVQAAPCQRPSRHHT